jgi:hypothetical protein
MMKVVILYLVDNLRGYLTMLKNANFEKTEIERGYGYSIYTINGFDGMTDEDIIDACDRNNFGGSVCGNTCKVYTD